LQAAEAGGDLSAFELKPVGQEGLSAEYEELKSDPAVQNSHLVTHSESQGVYIPLEMKQPLQTEKTHPGMHILGTFPLQPSNSMMPP
jgi:hypothetical protein